MPSAVERQFSMGAPSQPAHTLGMPDCNYYLLHDLEDIWGGPLPGAVQGIQENPLRCELRGPAPERLLQAAGIEWRSPLLQKYWSLYPAERVAGVYHSDLNLVVLPALPDGLVISTSTNAVRQIFTWDDCVLQSTRLYVNERIRGAVASCWPDLTPPCGDLSMHCFFGLEYAADLQVTRIQGYAVPMHLQPLSVVKASMMATQREWGNGLAS